MAARNRPRASQMSDDASEEKTLWNHIRTDARKVDALANKSDEITKKMVELLAAQDAAHGRGETPSAEIDDEVEMLARENMRLCNEVQSLVGSDPGSNNVSILSGLEVLSALRAPSEAENPSSRATAATGKSSRNLKRKLDVPTPTPSHRGSALGDDDRDSIAAESPGGPSPKLAHPAGAASRLIKGGSRAGSVPAGRESSVKAEEGEDSAAPSAKASTASRQPLQVGVEVFYRNKTKAVEGEGILCSITNVIGEGKQRRYEIKDSDPEPPTPPVPYRASVSHLVAIPPTNSGLVELPPKKQVLALYPGTTTFYKAEVVAPKSGAQVSGVAGGPGSGLGGPLGDLEDGYVRLRFEGEEEAEREMDVERRYVLPEGGK
ncbi:SGF29 tudor-like domain-containing protein [Lineolata rhizophorae]|uniref:SGF29 tudor-like domain-containing protein n=1 Tax=Lineolata rhizophorae TaxID=578093 RepID=A0A6A6NMG2_9PEZI|nr:SGF29 tudor-like domain-containing protein [Lineolata rhizophorae]